LYEEGEEGEEEGSISNLETEPRYRNDTGKKLLENRKLLAMLFDYLDPNDSGSLTMFFASKKVFSNIDVMAARITES